MASHKTEVVVIAAPNRSRVHRTVDAVYSLMYAVSLSRRNRLSVTLALTSTIPCLWLCMYAVFARLHPEVLLHTLQTIQNGVARLVSGTHERDHITPVLFKLHWLPVRYRMEFKLLVLVYLAVHHLGPGYLASPVTPYCKDPTAIIIY